MSVKKPKRNKMNKTQQWALVSASAGFGLENMDVLFLSFTLVPIILSLHISQGQAGLIGTLTNWGMLVGAIIFGLCADRFGRIKTFNVSILVFALATAGMGFANDLNWVYLLRFLTGIGAGGEYGIGMTILAEAFLKKEMGKISSIAAIGGQLGALMAAGLAAVVIPSLGWHALYLFGLIPILLVFLVRFKLPESQAFTQIHEQVKVNIRIVVKTMFKDWETAYQTVGLMVMATVQIAGYFGLMNWLPSIVGKQANINVSASSLWMISTILGMMVGMSIFGWVLDRVGPTWAFSIFLLGSAIMVFVFSTSHNVVSLIILGVLLGLFTNGMFGGYGAVISLLYPTEIRSSANSIIVGFGRAIGGMSSLIIGIIMDHSGIITVVILLAVLYLVSFFFMITNPGIRKLSKRTK